MIAWWRRLDRRGRIIVAASHVAAAAGTWAIVWWWRTYAAQYVVSNILPPSGETLLALWWVHLKMHAKLDANHEDMKQHVTASTGGTVEDHGHA